MTDSAVHGPGELSTRQQRGRSAAADVVEGPRVEFHFRPRISNEPVHVVDQSAVLNERRAPVLGRQGQVPQSLSATIRSHISRFIQSVL